MNIAAIPWDFYLILIVLGTLVPWRGAVRVKRLLSGGFERLSLYASTIAYQWLLVAFVAWRAFSRKLEVAELGLALTDPVRTLWITLALTILFCGNQFASLRMMRRVPEEKRGFMFRLTEKIMPRTWPETLLFAGLACTAGVSEEFLYRGFIFAIFRRMFANIESSVAIAVVLSSLWFAVAHLYQGRRGVITTFIVGLVFCLARIWSGSLLPSVVAHSAIDLIAGLLASKLFHDPPGINAHE